MFSFDEILGVLGSGLEGFHYIMILRIYLKFLASSE